MSVQSPCALPQTRDREHWILRPASCPVCGETASSFVGYRGGWAHSAGKGIAVTVVRCPRCGLLYAQPTAFPRDLSHYDEDGYFGPYEPAAKISAAAATLATAAGLLGGTGRMLDIGCGRGESLVAARRAGWTARGLDPSPRFAAEGRELFGVQIECAEIHDAEIDSASVDLVLLSGVLEHVYEPMALLTEAARVLRPGGLVVVDVPNERSLVQRAAQAYLRTRARDWTLALSPTFPPYHVIGFSRRALRFALSSAGLETLELSTYALRLDVHATGRAARMAARLELVAQRIGAASGLLAWARKPALES